ncbi:S26 family signal peptidase [Streptomyces sp. NPDC005890]|uniref:S26 family signal peptidase n=1 Tax=Streptomyces sp. NPDC005890 TaxID=3154568 RepID=UPI0033CBB45C
MAGRGWLLGVVPAGGAYLYGHGAYGTGTLPSQSMEPTYQRGDQIIWERMDGSEVRRGDVVTFSMPERYRSGGVLMQRGSAWAATVSRAARPSAPNSGSP